ncbi:MAG: PAS domain S-box protein [Fimbriimonadaceae bacterium]|nr:PAS domain S-box protein [Fimbriimonadaceae bacterium]
MTSALPVQSRANELFAAHRDSIYRFTDRLFCFLMMAQYLGAIIAALALSPKTWEGQSSAIHPHVWTALILGGLISMPTAFITGVWPGRPFTRYVVAVNQMLMGALLIHISGGRIETHFHVFGSLAFLAFYRDWKLLIPATLIVLVDHIYRGLYMPTSVYGVFAGAQWRFIEHAGWVVFENIILVASIVRGCRDMEENASRQAEIEFSNERIEAQVVERTAELMASERHKAAVLNNAMDGIVTFDSEGLITEINPAALAIFQLEADDAVGKDFIDLLIAEQCREALRQRMSKFHTQVSHVPTHARWELLGQRRSDKAFEIELSVCPIKGESIHLFTAFVRDLSEKISLETQLAQAQKMESIGNLAAGIAHEINTPNQYIGDNIRFLQDSIEQVLGAVDGFKTLIEGSPDDLQVGELKPQARQIEKDADLAFIAEEMPAAVSQALEGVETVGGIVKAMKEFSHPGVKNWTTVELNRIIEGTLTVSRNEWKYVANVEADLDPNLPTFRGHPGELGQVILNLVVNSAHAIREKHTDGEKGTIKIKTYEEDGNVVLWVSDNGCGIPEDVQRKVFDPFFTTKGVGIGTGQGLSITHNVVHRHEGLITLESTVGEGTEFTLKFPIERRESDDAFDWSAA